MPNDRRVEDLSSILEEGRLRTERLIEGYFAAETWAKRGGYVQLLVKELSNLISVREEVLRPLLRELVGGLDHVHRLDEARNRQLELLSQVDELTMGVGPRDIHQHQADRIIDLIRQLRSAIDQFDAYEADELVPFIEAQLDRDRLEQLGLQARRATKRGPTHAHPKKPPADQRSTLGKAATGVYDRLHDMADHPEEAVETGGQEGP